MYSGIFLAFPRSKRLWNPGFLLRECLLTFRQDDKLPV